MKRIITLIIAVLLVFSISACAKEAVIDLDEIKTELENAEVFVDELVPISAARIESVINLDVTLFSEGRGDFYIGSGYASGEEFGLFECNSANDAKTLVTQLEQRRDDQYELYASYATEALPLISNTVIKQSGKYVVYVAAADFDKAREIVDKAFA